LGACDEGGTQLACFIRLRKELQFSIKMKAVGSVRIPSDFKPYDLFFPGCFLICKNRMIITALFGGWREDKWKGTLHAAC